MARLIHKEEIVAGEIRFACYRPKEGKEMELKMLLKQHVPLLRKEGYVTLRPPLFLKARSEGTFIEVFQWVDRDAAKAARENPRVLELWEKIGQVAEVVTLASLAEAAEAFPDFDVVQGVVCN